MCDYGQRKGDKKRTFGTDVSIHAVTTTDYDFLSKTSMQAESFVSFFLFHLRNGRILLSCHGNCNQQMRAELAVEDEKKT